jgi:tetratricopeptide (TPR) repeat protein
MLRIASLLLLPSLALSGSITPEMDRALNEGLDAIYTMDFDAADNAARKVMELSPEHPYGHFGYAAAALTRYIYETDQTDQSVIPVFEQRIAAATRKAKAWLEKNPRDADVLMVAGACYGIASRMQATRHQWIKAYFSGRKAMSYTRASLKHDPQLFDSYLGLGMYDYYTDAYPRVIGVLAKIMLRGNRQRGISELKIAAEKGRYGSVAAKLILVEIYTEHKFGTKNPEEAVRLMAEVRRRYPESAMLHSADIVSLYEAKRHEDVRRGALDFLSRVSSGTYAALQLAKGEVMLGTALWALGEKEAALEALKAGSGVRLGGQLSRWAVWGLIRAGQLSDVLGRREEAVRFYKAAFEQPDLWGLRAPAEKGLSKPYSLPGPGPMPPPDVQ